VVRATLSAQIDRDFRVVAVAATTGEAIELAARHQPDAALIDVQMPGGGAREAVPQIATTSPDTCIVILSSDESHSVVLELLSAGAITYIRKGIPGPEISKTLSDAISAKGTQPH
jgi:DNA-binding NarL/FixJ family response regulator